MLPPPALTVSISTAGKASGMPPTAPPPSASGAPPTTRLASALVRRVAKREQQGDGDGFGRERAHGGDYTRHLPVRERLEHAGGPHALRSPHHVVPDHERRGVVACQVVQCRAILTSEP